MLSNQVLSTALSPLSNPEEVHFLIIRVLSESTGSGLPAYPPSSKEKPALRRTETIKTPSTAPNVERTCTATPVTSVSQIALRRPHLGLENLGNTCYANAILNCLFPFPEP